MLIVLTNWAVLDNAIEYLHDLTSPGMSSKQHHDVYNQYKLFCLLRDLDVLEYEEAIEGVWLIRIRLE